MKLSDNGIRLIKRFEGYHRKLPDGGCIAYRCPAGVWTLGYGSTAGIKPGMIWTEAQAEAALRDDVRRFESAVLRLVRVPLNQNQFDALVSFTYNVGEGALAKSSLLRAVNAGDMAAAARAFALWNKAKGKVLPGLVERRAREAALFTRPVPEEEAIGVPNMPQEVDAPADKPVGSRKIATARVGEGTALGGLGLATLMSYINDGATFLKTYGIEIGLLAAFVIVAYFAAIKHFTRQDYEEGSYVPSRERQS